MDQTANLALPFILPAQAQKHVTHNEALQALDALVQLSVLSRSLADPPGAPAEGDRYLVPAGATGAWAGRQDSIAAFQSGGWTLFAPRRGWLAWVGDEEALIAWSGAGWTAAGGEPLNPAELVGVNTTADAVNRLAVKSEAVLISHDDVTPGSGSVRIKLNKAAPEGTASLVLQTGWSGRAEWGLTGDDDLRLKVSADGDAWTEALRVDRESGETSVRGLRQARANGAPAGTILFTPGGDGAVSLYRTDSVSGQNPRTAVLASVSGDTLTLSEPVADTIFGHLMGGVSYARIWNVSRSPDGHSAWVRARPDASTLELISAASTAGWLPGDTIQLGDPLSVTPGRCITLDISPMLFAVFGTVFRQTGIVIRANIPAAAAGDGLGVSPTGIAGSFVSCAAAPSSAGVTMMACTEPSPVSNSNLVRLREQIAGTATTRLVSSIAVLA
ncbi:uncharacterized protein DUF2793 [Hoeflea marina]|uniref:Uncharacterized protein DUF2793 n=1 Tax=Hoeflea marina TaxID=274592 RepID=A0A317PKP3_9HYPH|nr:DUF2793 domain-containing protein [Hoeflea marina]PWW00235.1 uncharacterized protein DUF2793 [Hoeflea marina]